MRTRRQKRRRYLSPFSSAPAVAWTFLLRLCCPKNWHPRQSKARYAHVALARLHLNRRRLVAGALPFLFDLGAAALIVAAQLALLLLLSWRRRFLRRREQAAQQRTARRFALGDVHVQCLELRRKLHLLHLQCLLHFLFRGRP